LILFALVAGVLALPASAGADGSRLPLVAVAATDLADATGAVAPSAAAGHVVFSRQAPSTGRFELVAWSAGRGLRVLPVGDRAVPFDADVGRDAPVAQWSATRTARSTARSPMYFRASTSVQRGRALPLRVASGRRH
jgi:hypothetical protein